MKDDQQAIFPDQAIEESETVPVEEKPRRRYRRRKKVEEVQEEQQPKRLDEKFVNDIAASCAESLDTIVSHLPKRWFDQRNMSDGEKINVQRGVAIALESQVQSDETLSKFMKWFPLSMLTLSVGIVVLSRIKKRDEQETA